MIKNYVRGEEKELTEYELTFDDGCNNGFAFPCNKDGKLLDGLHQAAIDNYNFCMEHPEKFKRYNKVITLHRFWREPDRGTCCNCGETVYLTNNYMGACQCTKCGQWYNVWGQELLPPEMWEE